MVILTPQARNTFPDHFHNDLVFLGLDYSRSFPVIYLGTGEMITGWVHITSGATVSHNLARTPFIVPGPQGPGAYDDAFSLSINGNSDQMSHGPQIVGYFSFVSV